MTCRMSEAQAKAMLGKHYKKPRDTKPNVSFDLLQVILMGEREVATEKH